MMSLFLCNSINPDNLENMQLRNNEFEKISKKFLNFSKGKWFIIPPKSSGDSRILEYEFEGKGFLYESNMIMKKKMAYICPENRVMVFYPDKEPNLAKSLAQTQGIAPTSEKEVLQVLSDMKTSFPDILTLANNFPYTDTDNLYKARPNRLLNFGRKLKNYFDSKLEFPYLDTLPGHIEKQTLFMENVAGLLYDMFTVRNFDILSEENYQENPEYQEALSAQQEAKKVFFESHKKAMYKVCKKSSSYSNLFKRLFYYSQKLIRDFFFVRTRTMFNTLFTNYQVDSTTLEEAISQNLVSMDKMQVLDIDRIPLLKVENWEKTKAATNFYDFSNPNHVSEYLQKKIDSTADIFNKIWKDLIPIFENELGSSPGYFSSIQDDTKYLKTLLRIFNETLENQLFVKYTQMFHEALKNMPSIKDNNITNITEAKQFTVFRRHLMMAGQIDYVDHLDRRDLRFTPIDIFREGRRLLLL